jgi:hypothetical protein
MTLSAVEAIVEALGKQIDAPTYLLPSFERNEDGARPEVRVDGAGYHFVVIERGKELQNKAFNVLEDLLKEIFESITFSMALDYEVRHRLANQDFRIILFAKQVELLTKLDATWAALCRSKADRLLE